MADVGIVDYGMGNVRSVQKAIEFIGKKAIISKDFSELDSCDKLILPGVGSFGVGIAELKSRGLYSYIRAAAEKKYILGICLGMQFLLTRSEEDGDHAGFDFCKGNVVKFKEGKTPQIGWNQIFNLSSPLFNGIEGGSEFYFVHSFYADTEGKERIATANYYIDYAAAVWNGKYVFGTQFHPEKSGDVGIKVLKNFVEL